jgi:hypothetical protein
MHASFGNEWAGAQREQGGLDREDDCRAAFAAAAKKEQEKKRDRTEGTKSCVMLKNRWCRCGGNHEAGRARLFLSAADFQRRFTFSCWSA